MNRRRSWNSAVERVAALVCAATYLFGGMELVPQLLALCASLEGSHKVQISRDESRFTVVLSHEGPAFGKTAGIAPHSVNVPHRHGAAARVFCVFAEQASSRAGHVASFATGALGDRPAGAMKTAGTCQKASAAAASAHSFSNQRPGSLKILVAGDNCYLPRLSDNLVLLRSTVLVV